MSLTIEIVVNLLANRGRAQYGAEEVSQIEHALQCGTLAQAAGASPSLITAAVLHDFGHLVHELGDDPAAAGTDDLHQYLAQPFLRHLFPEAVLGPIRLHVEAKRYLCAFDPSYWDLLSFASQRSLELQGGVYTQEEAESFIAKPYAKDAVALRHWDDEAKIPGLATPGLDHFAAIMESCRIPASCSA